MMTGTGAARSSAAHHRQRYPERLTLDLSQDDHDALMGARYADRIPMADRIRALISLWRQDPALAEAVSIRAQELLPPPPGTSAPPTEQPHAEGGPPAS